MNCERCKKNKVDFLFSKDSSICKKCVSELEKAIPKRKTKYQLRKLNKTITPEKYLELLKLHNECCHLCLKPYKREKLVLKYSFFNGEPIGVFCPRCLTAIGLLEESPEITQRLTVMLNIYYPSPKNLNTKLI